TDRGRTVYGGGGITPDEKYTAPKYNKFQTEILRKYALYNFSAKFFGGRSDTRLPKGWEPDDKLVNDFRTFLQQNKVEFSGADFDANRDWVRHQLKREMYITAFGVDESRQVAVEQDPEVQQAIVSMAKARGLLDNAKKQMVRNHIPEPVQ